MNEDKYEFHTRMMNAAHKRHKEEALNFRGRRLRVCRAIDDIIECIHHLGEQPARQDFIFDADHNVRPHLAEDVYVNINHLPVVTAQEKAELKNLAIVLQRLILTKNDQGPAPAKMQSF